MNSTIVSLRNTVSQFGSNYHLLDIHTFDMLRTLVWIEFATLDVQSVMKGWTSGYAHADHRALVSLSDTNSIIIPGAYYNMYAEGQIIAIGTEPQNSSITYGRTINSIKVLDGGTAIDIGFSGLPVNINEGDAVWHCGWIGGFSNNVTASSGGIIDLTSGQYPCSYRGIENLWGSIYQWIDGINFEYGNIWIGKDASTYQSNLFAYPYEKLSSYDIAMSNGYVVDCGMDWIGGVTELPAMTSTMISDSAYGDYYLAPTGQTVAAVGGDCCFGSSAGIVAWNMTRSSDYQSPYYGSRMVKKQVK